MLFRKDILEQIAAKRVTLAFRRWKKPGVKAGDTLTTAAGVLVVDAVDRIAMTKIAEADVKRAGYPSRAALLKELSRHPGADVYRVAFRLKGGMPRIASRDDGRITKTEMKSIIAALRSFDQSSEYGPWTAKILRLIDKYPARRAPDLAASQRRDPIAFQRDVLRLKQLGLAESLEIGYRLSPRGRAVLAEIEADRQKAAPTTSPRISTAKPLLERQSRTI